MSLAAPQRDPAIYVFDTNSLVEAHRNYPTDVAPPLWERIELLISAGQVIAPEQVLEELREFEGITLVWAEAHQQMFVSATDALAIRVMAVLREFEGLGDVATTERPAADPWIVGLALETRGQQEQELWGKVCMVITQERRDRQVNPAAKPRIPRVCAHYGLHCGNFLDFIRRERVFG